MTQILSNLICESKGFNKSRANTTIIMRIYAINFLYMYWIQVRQSNNTFAY